MCVMLLSSIALGLVWWVPRLTDHLVQREMEHRATTLAQVLEGGIEVGLKFDDRQFLAGELRRLAAVAGAELGIVYDNNGTIFASWPEPVPASAPSTPRPRGLAWDHGAHQLVITRTIGEQGTLTVILSTAELEDARAQNLRVVVMASAGLLVVGIALSWVMGTVLIRPLERLTATADGISSGKVDLLRAAHRGPDLDGHVQDETIRLTVAFQRMAGQLATQIEALQQERLRAQQAEERALHASRTKSTFLSNMSHELRTPLNAILGYSELLQEELQHVAPQECVEDTLRIHRAGSHLLQVINDVLDLSKIEAEMMPMVVETFDLDELIQAVVELVGPQIRQSGNRLVVRGLENRPDIELHSDATRIRQCLLNLLGNATKFTHRGTITVHTAITEHEGRPAVEIGVQDTGIGMNDEQLNRVFNPFEQADTSTTRRYGGTGLGLTLCRHLAERLGGSLRAESTPGRGSTFTLTVPQDMPTEPVLIAESSQSRGAVA